MNRIANRIASSDYTGLYLMVITVNLLFIAMVTSI